MKNLSPRSTTAFLLAAQAILAVALVGVFFYASNVQAESRKSDRVFAEENRAAIVLNCREREEIKNVIATIMDTAIRLAIEEGDLRRAESYQAIVDTRLTPTRCIP